MVKLLKKDKKPLRVILFDIDYTLFDTDIFKETKLKKYLLYKEVIDTVLKLQKIAILGIFSEGDLHFQKTKLVNTNIYKHFMEDHIHIVANKSEAIKGILQKYNDINLFLADDKQSILHEAKKHMPNIFTIWVKRGIFADVQKDIKGFEPDARVLSLEEIVEIIKNN